MSDWEAVKARLAEARSIGEQDDDLSVHVKVADIRAALERDDEVKRLIDRAGDWIETDPSLRSAACIEVALDHAKELDSEVVALRQRVEALEDCILHHSCEGYEEEGVCSHTRALRAAKGEGCWRHGVLNVARASV